MLSQLLGSPIRIGLSKKGIGIFVSNHRFWEKPNGEYDTIFLSNEGSEADVTDQYEQSLRQLFTQKKISRKKINVILADEDVRYLIVAPAKNSKTLQDCKDAAHARFKNLYDELSTDWEIEADWNNQSAFLGCAVQRKLTSMLHHVAKDFNSVIVELVPQFIAVFNKNSNLLGANDWLISCGEDAIVVGIVSNNRLHGIRTVKIRPNETHPTFLTDFCDQLAMQYQLPSPQTVYLYGSRLERFKESSRSKFVHCPSQKVLAIADLPTLLWEQTVSGLKL